MRFNLQARVCLFAVAILSSCGLLAASAHCATTESLFTSQTPAQQNISDGPSINYELGTKIESAVAGQFTAIRFWKSAGDVGTHTGKVWSSSGKLLAAVTFSGESAFGWQQQYLSSPLTVSANTVYVVTVNTANTNYATTNDGLMNQVTNQDLRSVVGGNGVFGAPGQFPTSSWQGSNYFRDVLFTKTSGATKQLSINTTGLNVGNVPIGTNVTHTVTLSNTGNSTLSISSIAISGPAFTDFGIATPMTLTPGETATLNVKFAPGLLGVHNGAIAVTSDASTTPGKIILTGNGVPDSVPQLSVVPGSVSFGDVSVGVSNTQTVQLRNTGASQLIISQATSASGPFSVSGISLPLTIAAGQSASFTVRFTPSAAGAASLNLALTSNAPNSPAQVPVSGTGVQSSLSLSANPPSLSFGSIIVNTASSNDTVTLTNTGNATVQLTGLNVSGSEFHLSGISLPVKLSAGQSATFHVDFAPTTSGNASGNVSIVSTAKSAPTIGLSGTGAAVPNHTVVLDWSASQSSISGYNVYRSTQSGQFGSPLNSGLVGGTSFTDTSVQNGQTYYYVTTAVASNGEESAFSNQSSVVIP